MRIPVTAAIIVAALAIFLTAPACAQDYDSIGIVASQPYLRAGMNDTVTLTVQLYDNGNPVARENVPIGLNFLSARDYMVFDNQLIVTNATGGGTAALRMNASNVPERYRMPVVVQVEAAAEFHRNNVLLYITTAGSVSGYVVNDEMSTITGARITVKSVDGRHVDYAGGPFYSSDGTGTPMGYYKIDNLPINVGKYTLTAEKGGITGSIIVEAGYSDVRYDITIDGYYDTVNVSHLATGNQSNGTSALTVTPTPTPEAQPDRPVSVITTIIIAIVLITLVYLGLKAYRRMF